MGVLDSIKTITINSFNSNGPVLSEPANNAQIKISKSHGFVQVIELFCFPFHKPDTVYYQGYDYYLDQSLNFSGINLGSLTFNIVNFINPTFAQLNDWNVGDVFESRNCAKSGAYDNPPPPWTYKLDTIVQKNVDSTGITYVTSGWQADPTAPFFGGPPYNYIVYNTSHTKHFSNLLCFDTLMPEDNRTQNYLYYFPRNLSLCVTSPEYHIIPKTNLYTSLFSEGWAWDYYKLNIGHFDFGYQSDLPDFSVNTVIFYNGCGSIQYPPLVISNVQNPIDDIQIFPNPAYNVVSIKISNDQNQKYFIILNNMLGQCVRTFCTNKEVETIDVKNIPRGIYNLKISSESGESVNKKIVVE